MERFAGCAISVELMEADGQTTVYSIVWASRDSRKEAPDIFWLSEDGKTYLKSGISAGGYSKGCISSTNEKIPTSEYPLTILETDPVKVLKEKGRQMDNEFEQMKTRQEEKARAEKRAKELLQKANEEIVRALPEIRTINVPGSKVPIKLERGDPMEQPWLHPCWTCRADAYAGEVSQFTAMFMDDYFVEVRGQKERLYKARLDIHSERLMKLLGAEDFDSLCEIIREVRAHQLQFRAEINKVVDSIVNPE